MNPRASKATDINEGAIAMPAAQRKGARTKTVEAPPLAAYQEKEPTELHVKFAEWITEKTGYEVDLKSVQLATALRMPFQASPENQDLMIHAYPDRFFRPPYVGTSGWVGVYLDGAVDWQELGELLRDAWRMTAPKRLVKTETTEKAEKADGPSAQG